MDKGDPLSTRWLTCIESVLRAEVSQAVSCVSSKPILCYRHGTVRSISKVISHFLEMCESQDLTPSLLAPLLLPAAHNPSVAHSTAVMEMHVLGTYDVMFILSLAGRSSGQFC